jgi:hypothetical protein
MTKRIKIERPENLKEGMRVEVYRKPAEGCLHMSSFKGKLFKSSLRPSNPALELDGTGQTLIVDGHGELAENIQTIHRLIDGIEDVVEGDILKDREGDFVKAMGVRGKLVDCSVFDEELSSLLLNDYYRTKSFQQLKNEGCEIYIPEEPQKTELTQSEAKAIIAEAKGCEVDDVIIKDE